MPNTKGGLKPAKLIKIVNDKEVETIPCMFNPFEYTLTKQNQWEEKAAKGKNTGKANFVKGGSQSLKLSLYFDTLDKGTDIRKITDKLWGLMLVEDKKVNQKSKKGEPPEVAFEWGHLYFRAVLTNMTQKFTLFKPDGTPVRCTVDITLDQLIDRDDVRSSAAEILAGQNDSEEMTAVAGNRIDNIAAASENSNPSDHRKIAEQNNINNPLNIPPGTVLRNPRN